ncbi:MAG: universal stress protein [Gammaproteobacteria bacterium]|nr:universal stress protein [Gammaproteobacteria bacterium]
MSTYSNILAAIDLTDSAEQILRKAQELVLSNKTVLTVIHTIDYLPYMGFGETALITPTYTIPNEELINNAKAPIEQLLKKLNMQGTNVVYEFGNAANEIVQYAKENKVDLIVLGSHGRHGVKLLLGSTANAVLHHADCDVLAVRIFD